MAMQKFYTRINWQNRPSTSTPLGAQNLNHIDTAINEIDDRIVMLDAAKFDASAAQNLCNGIEYNEGTGVFVFHYVNGGTKRVDLNIEKIPVSMELSEQGVLTITNTDGTIHTANVAALLTVIDFVDSAEIDFQVTDSGKNRSVTAVIKDGSISETKLDPSIQEDILNNRLLAQTAAGDAQTYSNDSKRYAVGGVIVADAQDNAKFYCEQSAGHHAGTVEAASAAAESKEDAIKASDAATAAMSIAEEAAVNAANAASAAQTSEINAASYKAGAAVHEAAAMSASTAAETAAAEALMSKNAAKTSEDAAAESAENALTSENQARYWAEQAESVTNVKIATIEKPGIVKPDGTSIKVEEDGTISTILSQEAKEYVLEQISGLDISEKTLTYTVPDEYEAPSSGSGLKVWAGRVAKGIGNLFSNIGTLASLLTKDKTSIVAAMNEIYGDVQALSANMQSGIQGILTIERVLFTFNSNVVSLNI